MSKRYKIALFQEAKGESNVWRHVVEYNFVTDDTEEKLVEEIHELLDEIAAEVTPNPDPQSPAASPDLRDDQAPS